MAWDFVMNFARDNQLVLTEACLVPDTPEPTAISTKSKAVEASERAKQA
jgi:hypothetical protein